MELGAMIRQLWRLRLLVALGVLIAVAVAIPVGYDVSLSPLRIKQRSSTVGAAQQSMFVDTPRSSLVERPRGFDDSIGRAAVIGRLVNTPTVKADAARALGVTPGRITVEGPLPNGLQAQSSEPSAQQRANQVLGERSDLRVFVDTDAEAPIITLFTQAPTGAQAVELSEAVSRSLQRYVGRLTDAERPALLRQVEDTIAALPTAARRRVNEASRRNRRRALLSEETRIRVLGSAVGGNVSDQTGKAVVLGTFLGVFLAWCIFLLVVSGLVRSARRGR